MMCPKCNSGNQNGNFCSNCGLQLVEDGKLLYGKCRICGKTEAIKWTQKAICLDVFTKAKSEAEDYATNKVREHYGKWHFFIFEKLALRMPFFILIGYFALVILAVMGGAREWMHNQNDKDLLYFTLEITIAAMLLGVSPIIISSIAAWRRDKTYKKAEEEFLRFHTDYAELLKKAKGE